MADASNKQLNSIWTPANVITCVRILFIPLFMALALLSHHGALDFDPALSLAAFVLYMLLSLTDKVDGYLARSRNEITDFGKFLDPIADKLLVFSALLILLQQNTVNIWFVFIILLREFLVSALRMVASANGVVVAADKLGKWKTATTMVSLCGYLLSCLRCLLCIHAFDLFAGAHGYRGLFDCGFRSAVFLELSQGRFSRLEGT